MEGFSEVTELHHSDFQITHCFSSKNTLVKAQFPIRETKAKMQLKFFVGLYGYGKNKCYDLLNVANRIWHSISKVPPHD